ncbi:phosphatase PAP2 family protein [Sphingopyxis terrae]|uniref:phosphatase PAP2 family protein n=1 Tax=Sphingopyxis terrae TaxID=33052 RepID=UPI001C2C2D60|nr:phosphatase PAP2 family protein [Sphingopyxis terrae]QXF12034.1 phosphatase PAP2 family protein [Sphingopyxis terrae subsp. terrae]
MTTARGSARIPHRAVIILMLALAVLALGLLTRADHVTALDAAIARHLTWPDGAGPPPLIAFMQAISWIGGGTPRWVLVGLIAAAVRYWGGRRPALAIVAAVLFANIASSLLKAAFDRPRPDLIAHLDHVSSASYPSGHATSAAALYLTLALLVPPRWRRQAWTLAVLMIGLTGLSRIMLGVHWPSDIVGGTLLGAAFALAAAWWARSEPAGPA